VGGQDPGRADRGGLLVGLLEITPAERGQRACVAGGLLGLDDPARNGPADHLPGQFPDRVIVAAGGRHQGLQVLRQPGAQRKAMGLGRLEAFSGQPLGLVPLAGHEGIEGQQGQRADRREDDTSVPPLAGDPAQGRAAAGQPVGVDRRRADDQDAPVVRIGGETRDGGVQQVERRHRGTDGVGVGPGQQVQIGGNARAERHDELAEKAATVPAARRRSTP
jgi:hypothetical protein